MLEHLKQKDIWLIHFLKERKKRLKNWYISVQSVPSLLQEKCSGNCKAIHIAALSNGNAGDVLLPIILRDLFEKKIGVKKWNLRSVSKVVDFFDVNQYNKRDFVVIGGGGLFLKDSNPNNLSGWQWACPIEKLQQIKVPIIMFAVGYNRFRGQDDFEPIFTEHINAFVEKAKFVGLRNHGSIENIKSYLKSDGLKNKLVFQPCMTTLTSIIYPSLCDYSKKEDFIAVNCAFDRQSLRKNDDGILKQIANVCSKLSKITKIKIYAHMDTDLNILPYLDECSIEYEIVLLQSVEQIILDYTRPKLVIGMRGHAQMIPFGCNTPILSIISHDKMQWFLDDIHHSEWGVDVLDDNFETKLYEKAVEIYYTTDKIVPLLKEEQKILYEITLQNLKQIKDIVNK